MFEGGLVFKLLSMSLKKKKRFSRHDLTWTAETDNVLKCYISRDLHFVRRLRDLASGICLCFLNLVFVCQTAIISCAQSLLLLMGQSKLLPFCLQNLWGGGVSDMDPLALL